MEDFESDLVRRDFVLLALLSFMELPFDALSMALYTLGRSDLALSNSLATIAFLNSLIAARYAIFRRSFMLFFLFDCLRAFFAESVIGMNGILTH